MTRGLSITLRHAMPPFNVGAPLASIRDKKPMTARFIYVVLRQVSQ